MNIKIDEFKAIESALKLINFNSLSEDDQKIVINADSSMIDVIHRHKILNQKTAKYIAEKRKVDKNYARKKNK